MGVDCLKSWQSAEGKERRDVERYCPPDEYFRKIIAPTGTQDPRYGTGTLPQLINVLWKSCR